MNSKIKSTHGMPLLAGALLLISFFIPAFWVIVPQYGVADKISLWELLSPISVAVLLPLAFLIVSPVVFIHRKLWLSPFIASLIGFATFMFFVIHNIRAGGFQFTLMFVSVSFLFASMALAESFLLKKSKI